LFHQLLAKSPGLGQVVPVLSIIMEVFWTFAWIVWITSLESLNWDNSPLNLISSIILAVAVEVLNRFVLARQWSI